MIQNENETDDDELAPLIKHRPKLGEVTADAIRGAMRDFTNFERVKYASSVWDVFDPADRKRRYPPKRLLRNAIVQSGVGNWSFAGGKATNRHLEHAGFPVVLKESIQANNLLFAQHALEESTSKPEKIYKTLPYYERSRTLSDWVKSLANGQCGLCKQPAPFNTNSGPFLESHHITWLRKCGSDTFDNIIALCPNCHRRMHALDLESDISTLRDAVKVRFDGLPHKIQEMVRRPR